MIKSFLIVLVTVLGLQVAGARDFRELTNLEGKKIKAELLDLKEGKLKIRANSRVFEVQVNTLSLDDQSFLVKWDAVRKGEEDKLYYKELVFEDDFSGEDFSEAWTHWQSKSVLMNGVMVGKTIDINIEAGSDSIKFEGRRDLQIAVKFNFVGAKAERFEVWIDDKANKQSHLGHIFRIIISPTSLEISDAKTGVFANEIYKMRKLPGGLDKKTEKMLKSKMAQSELKLDREKWYELVIRTKNDKLVVQIDGKQVGELQSEGLAHLTKSILTFTTNVSDVHYDDLVIKAASNSAIEDEEKEKNFKGSGR